MLTWNNTVLISDLNMLKLDNRLTHSSSLFGFQRSRPTRGGTVRQQTTPANRDHLYHDSLLFVSAGFLPRVSLQRLNWSSIRPHIFPHNTLEGSCGILNQNQNHKAATTTTGPYPTPASSDGGRHTSESRAYCQVSLPCMCPRHTSRGGSYRCARCSGWVPAKCSGHLNAAQYRRNKDWTCDSCPASMTQQSTPPPPSPSLPNKIVLTARSTFYSSTLMELATNWQN